MICQFTALLFSKGHFIRKFEIDQLQNIDVDCREYEIACSACQLEKFIHAQAPFHLVFCFEISLTTVDNARCLITENI